MRLHALAAGWLAIVLTACGGDEGGPAPAGPADVRSVVLMRIDADGQATPVPLPGDGRKGVAAAGDPPTPIYPNRRTRLVGYAYVSVPGCQLIEVGTFTPTSQLQYGHVDVQVIDTLFGGGQCAGIRHPLVTGFYTWTAKDAPPGSVETVTMHYSAQGGAVVADPSWTFTISDKDKGKNQGQGQSCPAAGPEPDDDAPCPDSGDKSADDAKVGNPIHAGTGNKFQEEIDYTAAAHTRIGLTRYYNSTDATLNSYGWNWRSQWQRSVIGSLPAGYAQYVREDGRIESFTGTAIGRLLGDPDVTTTLSALGDGNGQHSGWQVVREDDSRELYAVDGRLLSVTTRAGQVTTLTYDANKFLTTVAGPFGHTVRFSYTGALITRMIAADGGVFQYGYDANSNLASVRYPDGTQRGYAYENAAWPHALTGIVDELGARYASFSYDGTGRGLTSQHAGGTLLNRIAYNTDGSATLTDARGVVRQLSFTTQHGVVKPAARSGPAFARSATASYSYAASGFVASRTDWNGTVSLFSTDARGNRLAQRDASGTAVSRVFSRVWHPTLRVPLRIDMPTRSVSYTHDAAGNVLSRTEQASGANRTWRFSYSALGQPLTATDPLGRTTSFAYDAQGGLARMINPLGHVTRVAARDANGRPLVVIDPNGLTVTLGYDQRGRLLTRSAGGLLTRYAYDAAGNLSVVTPPDGSALALAYDAAHRLVGITDSLGNRIAFTLDPEGNRLRVAVYDAAGALSRTASYEYDAAGRVVRASGAQGQTTVYERDANGNVVNLTDPLGRVSRIQYDALNRPIRYVDPMGGVTSLTHDAMDRVTSVTDPRRLTTGYVYNGLGDLLAIQSPDSGRSTRTVDAGGNVLTSTDARGAVVTRAYDALNRLSAVTFSGGRLVYRYDAGANAIGRLTDVSGDTDSTQFAYDLLGRLLQRRQVVDGASLTQSNTYDAVGRLAAITYPSGMRVGYQYDAAGQVAGLSVDGAAFMTSVQHEPFGPVRRWNWAGQTAFRSHDTDGRLAAFSLGSGSRALSYDAAGQITAYRDSTGQQQGFGYDPLGRLVSYGAPGVAQAYGYDADGNRTHLTANGITSLYWVSASSNQLLARTDTTATAYSHDAAGNQLSDGTRRFAYDALGRMSSSTATPGTGAPTAYTTNGLGERVRKSGPVGTTAFLYGAGGRLMGEYGSAGNQETLYLDGMPVGLKDRGSLFRIFADQLGAPRLIADSRGSVAWSWGGDPFGNAAPTGTLNFNQRFPGQYFDAESGLHFNMARYYDPSNGRYTQSDPIGLRGGINPYSYVGGNPVSSSDSMGLLGEWDCTKLGDCTHVRPAGTNVVGSILEMLPRLNTQKYLDGLQKACKLPDMLEKYLGVPSSLPLPINSIQNCGCKSVKALKLIDQHVDDIASIYDQLWHLDWSNDAADWQYRHGHDTIYAPQPTPVDPTRIVPPAPPRELYDPVFR